MMFKTFENKEDKFEEIIKVKLLDNGKLPIYKNKNTSSLILFSSEDACIEGKSLYIVPTGISISVNQKCRIDLVMLKNFDLPLLIVNNPGTIDMDYRGEIKIIFFNLSHDKVYIKKHDIISELLFVAYQKQISCERNNDVVQQ